MRYISLLLGCPLSKIWKWKCWCEYEENATVVHCWWESKLVQTLWKIIWTFLKKLKMNYHMIQRYHFQVYIWRKWNYYNEEISVAMHCSTDIYNSQNMEITCVSINWCTKKKMWYICILCVYVYMHTQWNILFRHEKEKILPFATMWIHL